MRPYGSPEQLEQRRLQAVTLFEKGAAPVDIARTLGVARRSVRRWKASYRKAGPNGVKAKPIYPWPSCEARYPGQKEAGARAGAGGTPRRLLHGLVDVPASSVLLFQFRNFFITISFNNACRNFSFTS